MKEGPMEEWEARLRRVARDFPYPPTPDLTGVVKRQLTESPARAAGRRQRLAWAVVAILIVLVGLLAVPQVRAAVLKVLRLGAVEIVVEPTPTATLSPMATEEIWPTASPLLSVLDLAGETTLAEARSKTHFPIRVPTYPPDLGAPDRVFFQNFGGPIVILVWVEPAQPDRVRLGLFLLGQGAVVEKIQPNVIQETTVHGQRALWTEGPYFVRLRGDYDVGRLIEGQTLIWTEGEVTYRLESDLPMEEAVRIAESLK